MLINFKPSDWALWAIHSSPNHCKKIPITYTYSILTPILSVALTNIFAFLYLLFLKHIRYPPDFLIWFVSSQLHVGLFRFGMNSGHGDFHICIGVLSAPYLLSSKRTSTPSSGPGTRTRHEQLINLYEGNRNRLGIREKKLTPNNYHRNLRGCCRERWCGMVGLFWVDPFCPLGR